MRSGSWIGKVQTAVEVWAVRFAAGILLALMFLTAFDIGGRFIFNNPITGAYELSGFLLVGIVFLSVGYIQATKGHVAVEVVTKWLPKRAQIGLEIFGYVLGLAVYSIVTWQSGVYAWKAWRISDYSSGVIALPLWPAESMVPIGMGILCLRLVSDIYRGIDDLLAQKSQTSI